MRVVWKDPACWMLFEDGERLVLDVLVTTAHTDSTTAIELDAEQIAAYRARGLEYARELAEEVQRGEPGFELQIATGFGSEPAARDAVAQWRRDHDAAADERAEQAWVAIESYAHQALASTQDDPQRALDQLLVAETLQSRLALQDPAAPDDVAARLRDIVTALLDSVSTRGVAVIDPEVAGRLAVASSRDLS